MPQAPSSYYSAVDVLVAAALTPLHPGAGRSPGVVDLPVQRDPYGYPLVPATGFKGALKSFLAQRRQEKGIPCIKDGKVNCGNEECSDICCILGPEVGEGDRGASAIAFTDLVPLLVPVPSLTAGFVYVTSPLLASRVRDVIEAAGGPSDLLDALNEIINTGSNLDNSVATSFASNKVIAIGLDRIPISSRVNAEKLTSLDKLVSELSSIYSAKPISRALIVAPDSLAPSIIEKGLYRITRVRLDRSRKTVAKGALWTEEYLPPGILLVGAVAYAKPRNQYCKGIDDARATLHSMLGNTVFSIVLGGKESTGHGLLKVKIL